VKFEKGKPRPAKAGRKAGTPNKATVAAKDAIALAAEQLGGTDRLVSWVKEDPANEKIFWGTIYPKLLPLQVTGENGGPVMIEDARAKLLERITASSEG